MNKIEGLNETNWPERIWKLIVKGSVLDLCGGGGKFYPVFKGKYTCVDIDKKAISIAKKRFPKGQWICENVAKWKPDKKYDNIFTWVGLQHIPPRDIEKVFKMMKETSKNIIMCERVFDPVDLGPEDGPDRYLWTHNYKKHFSELQDLGPASYASEVHLMHWRKK